MEWSLDGINDARVAGIATAPLVSYKQAGGSYG